MCAYLFSNFIPSFENIVDLDQLASNETSIRIYTSGSTPNIESNRRERSGSVVECLTRDQRAAGSSLTGVTALWSLSKTHLS